MSERPYPDFPFEPPPASERPGLPSAVSHSPYAAVQKCFELLGLDRANVGTGRWNPLREFIHPEQQVLIKPNWAMHENASGGDLFAVITHNAVLRPVLEYVLLALEGRGRVILGDAPIQSADFDLLMRHTRTPELLDQLRLGGVEVKICDFRQNICRLDRTGRVLEHLRRQTEDNACTVDLGRQSFLEPVSGCSRRFRVTNYDPASLRLHHQAGRHEYLIAKAALESDVVIQVPKLKTHRKAGLTCCLKNVVGINASKDYLPHHRMGSVPTGGDEYRRRSLWKSLASRIIDFQEASPTGPFIGPACLALRVCRKLARHFAADPYTEGSWYGNDTLWRTVLDLNRVLERARPDGTIAQVPQRRVFYVVDAIMVGGGEGPLLPRPVPMGAVLAGFDAAALDACAARLSGLDERKVPLLRHAMELADRPAGEAMEPVLIESPTRQLKLEEIEPMVRLLPPAGWVGHVELDPCEPGEMSGADEPALMAEE